MRNPWLAIPAADYEGHMSSPEVGQAPFLARAFADALREHDSRSVAMLGCATGNGLQGVDPHRTRRVTAVDLNPRYLDVLRRRHAERLPGLEIIEADLERCDLGRQVYTLVFAGLIFEYLQPRPLLARIAGWLRPAGVLVTVLQLPGSTSGCVSRTRYTSLRALEPIMALVPPAELRAGARAAGLRETAAKTVRLESGKTFSVATFRRRNTHDR